MVAYDYILEQQRKALNECPYHLQIEVRALDLPDEERLESFDPQARVEGTVVTVFREPDGPSLLGSDLTVVVPSCIPRERVDLLSTTPMVYFDQLSAARLLEVVLDDSLAVVWGLIEFSDEPSVEPRLSVETAEQE